jgi:hypothetical protein
VLESKETKSEESIGLVRAVGIENTEDCNFKDLLEGMRSAKILKKHAKAFSGIPIAPLKRPRNKPRLYSSPGFEETRTIARREWPDMQAFHAFGTLVEHRFCLLPTPAFCHGAGIFSPSKLRAESLRSTLPKGKYNADAYGCHQDDGGDNLYLRQA